MKKIYLSRDGYEKLTEELEYLKRVKRKEIAKSLEHARSLGDLRENAEYQSAKEALAQNEARISDLEDKLTRVEIIDDIKISADKVYIGATVILLDLESKEEIEYKLVGPDEANPQKNLISTTSPVGKALLGHKIDETIEITVPAGVLKYKLLKISR